ncbi:bifunctional 3'-5' exonuclease/DNA polymerase [Micromonospora sp. NBC_01813]|uniref:bifunctional 3'-5' exonuclease/DNA polymerase n=1 Tax=Micromonospora sp. NBC_01813 TaxID=2975988 RepID=UPI002DD9EF25|nr:bifunctional 3'-5' exonuclease/DNA polymerase [Micromonospora sp. NBC_01813]WSA09972.1 bifunctional 3'-5' exonuclease/DNA polymerase [Micromonospora sp. NBC_01813]
MLVAVAAGSGGGGSLRPLPADGTPTGSVEAAPVETVPDLAGAVAARSAAPGPPVRWLWAATSAIYPALLRAGARVERCHDVELTEALLLGHAGRWGEPRSLAAAHARLTGTVVPPDPPAHAAEPPGHGQPALFDDLPAPATVADPLGTLATVYADQQRRIATTERPDRFRLLVAAESAGALAAAEMGAAGLPWRADVHDALLTELLGPPSPVGGQPRRLGELSARIAAAFGVRQLHADSPAEVLRAFARAGISVPNTRAWVLRGVDHPAVPLLLEYKELHRIWTAHGWTWRDAWVRDGRFRPEYVAGGVVSGRWATRGGGALQIPKVIRRAAVADPGWCFVVADAAQLEPRVLAAMSGDRRLAAAAAAGDLYAALAHDAFGGDRDRAKVALLGAMYGQTGGAAVPALAVLRRNYPVAFEYVESAARTGEAGGLVRSWLGRTCPPAGGAHLAGSEVTLGESGIDPLPPEQPGAGARARGRFTRNFVIQATAAEWALILLATIRQALAGTAAELVFFQHDEVVVHCPVAQADEVTAALRRCAEQATAMLFGDTPVRVPLDASTVSCYADAA